MVSAVFLDKVLGPIDRALNMQGLPLTIYLIFVFGATFILALILSSATRINRHRNRSHSFRSSSSSVAIAIMLINMILLLVGIGLSVNAFHYSSLAVFSMFAIPISFYVLAMTKTSNNKSNAQLRTLALILAILTIFVFGSRHLINGVEEHETTSDMINIAINGYFRWSIHGSHYDLAPLDAILKVVLSYITGDTIFSPILASIMYTCYGLASFLLIYVLARTITSNSNYALAVTLLAMLSYPYSPLIGLSIPPAPHAHLLAVAALTLAMRSLLGHRIFTFSDYFVAMLLILASLLMHPSSLGLVLYLALITAWLAYKKNLTRYNHILFILLFSLMIHFTKVMYTAFVAGFANYMQALWDLVVNAFREREITLFAAKNPGYSVLPRLCLTGFATLLGYLAGLALPILMKILRRKQLSVLEQLFIMTLVFYGIFALVAVSTGLGGVSQSRIVMAGAQPYMELALILYLVTLMTKQNKSLVIIPLAISVLTTLITPNAMPQNYTIWMAAKGATINDHIIAYRFYGLVDKSYYANLYATCGDTARILAFQEHGEIYYSIGSPMAVVYYFIAPRVISAKSYWDPCIVAIYTLPRDTTSYVIDRAFDAWVYGFYIYAKR